MAIADVSCSFSEGSSIHATQSAASVRFLERLGGETPERLWQRWIEGHDVGARDRLVLSLAPMVKVIASRKIRELPAHCELGDLVSSGLVALMGAIDRFDPDKGATLEQYVWTRVSGAVVDELRRQDWAPRSLRRLERQLEEARHAFHTTWGRDPSDDELASAVGISTPDLQRHLERKMKAEILSLNAQVNISEHGVAELVDLVPDSRERWDPVVRALATDRAAACRAAIKKLSPRERQVLSLAVDQDMPGNEIARVVGISESRVSQVLNQTRDRLRAALRELDRQAA